MNCGHQVWLCLSVTVEVGQSLVVSLLNDQSVSWPIGKCCDGLATILDLNIKHGHKDMDNNFFRRVKDLSVHQSKPKE